MKLTNQGFVVHQKSPLEHHMDRSRRSKICFWIAIICFMLAICTDSDTACFVIVAIAIMVFIYGILLSLSASRGIDETLSQNDESNVVNPTEQNPAETEYQTQVNSYASHIMAESYDPVDLAQKSAQFKADVKQEVQKRRAARNLNPKHY